MMGHRVDYFIGRVTFNQRIKLCSSNIVLEGGRGAVLFLLLVLYVISTDLTVWF